jgi:homoaconitate hydratase
LTKGDILVAGYSFGSGSSREQAATALLHAGVRLVIAGSFSETFKRNAINNGLMVLESPALVEFLRANFQDGVPELTRRTNIHAHVDLLQGRVSFNDQSIQIPKVGKAAQELIVAGGLENWVKSRI